MASEILLAVDRSMRNIEQALLQDYYDFHIAANELLTGNVWRLVGTLKFRDSRNREKLKNSRKL